MPDKVYIYESHLGGGLFTSSEPLNWEELYCEECGDSDTELGEFSSFKEFYESVINNQLYFCKDKYDPFKHTEWLVTEYWLADAINTLVAYWNYPFEEIKVDRYNCTCELNFQELMNKAYEIMLYEDKRFCYEVECFDGDIYYLEVGLIEDLLNMYPEERPLDFTYSLIEKEDIPKDCNVMTHMPVCFWDEFETWKERTQYNEAH